VTPVTNVDLHRRSPAARRPSPDDGRLFLNNRGRPLSPKALTAARRHVDAAGGSPSWAPATCSATPPPPC
jgi:hypothetical protein